jgi:hypothetical protein
MWKATFKSCNCSFTIIQTTMILKSCFRGAETLKCGRGSTPKMAGKSAVRRANWLRCKRFNFYWQLALLFLYLVLELSYFRLNSFHCLGHESHRLSSISFKTVRFLYFMDTFGSVSQLRFCFDDKPIKYNISTNQSDDNEGIQNCLWNYEGMVHYWIGPLGRRV